MRVQLYSYNFARRNPGNLLVLAGFGIFPVCIRYTWFLIVPAGFSLLGIRRTVDYFVPSQTNR
jgi:hypothetical protein